MDRVGPASPSAYSHERKETLVRVEVRLRFEVTSFDPGAGSTCVTSSSGDPEGCVAAVSRLALGT
jgi:hypothetical protein